MDLCWHSNVSPLNMLSRLVITFPSRSKCLLISWLQSPSAVILEPPKMKSSTISTVSLSICHEVMGPDAMIFVLWMLSFKPTFSFCSFTYTKRFFSSFSLSAVRLVSYAYLKLFIFLLAILIPACASSSPVFLLIYSAYKLNKHGDNIQPWCTPFPIWNHSVVPCPILTVAFWPAYRFFKRQVRWSGIPIFWRIFQFIVIHTVKGFGIVNKAERDVFLELSLAHWWSWNQDLNLQPMGQIQPTTYFWFIDYTKTFDCVDHNKLWKILKEMGIPDHLTCLLRNLYAGQEATVRTGHATTDWFQIGKGVRQGCI